MIQPPSTAYSAEGMLTCEVVHTAQRPRFVGAPFTEQDFHDLTADYERLESRVRAQFEREGATDVTLAREVGVRYVKQAHTLIAAVDDGRIDASGTALIKQRFERRYATVYGEGALLGAGAGIELETQRVNGTRHVDTPPYREQELIDGDGSAAVRGSRLVHFAPDGFVDTPVLDGDAIHAGETIAGPASVQRMGDSVVIPVGFTATVDRFGTIGLSS
jgi:N-methylhydantoinase A